MNQKFNETPFFEQTPPLKSQYAKFGFDLVVPIDLRNREDSRAWKLFLHELVKKWRRKDPYGEYFLVEENFMEWDVGEESFNPYIPFDPQYFRQFGCTNVAEDQIEHSDDVHQHIWRVARRYLGHRVRRADARVCDAQTMVLDRREELEALRDTVYALPPIDDDSPDGLWMWQLYEAGEVTALPPRRVSSALRPLAPMPSVEPVDTSIAAESRLRQDSANVLVEGQSMMDHPHPDMPTFVPLPFVPLTSHLGYTLPPNSFGLFPVVAVSP
jgi:hypothetical protein